MTASSKIEFPAERWGVEVRLGEVPERLADVTRDEGFIQVSATAFLVKVDHLGSMLVTEDEIVLAPCPDSSVESMDYLVYGWAPSFIRALRRQFSVHASAVMAGGGALAVMGSALAGKSTTVMGLIRRGYPLIIDDVLPVDFVDAVPVVHGWDRPIHLRESAADHFAVTRDRLVNTPLETKVQVRMPSHAKPVPLLCLVELRPDPDIESVTLRRLHGAAALRAGLRNTNSSGIATADGRGVDFFAWVTSLVDAVPVYQLSRPEGRWSLDSVLDELDELIRELTSGSQAS